MLKEIHIRNPFNPNLYKGVGDAWAYRDDEADREAINQERSSGMHNLNTALNEGFTRIESYSCGDYRIVLLHKTTREEAIKAKEAEDIRVATTAGIDYKTGLPIQNDATAR